MILALWVFSECISSDWSHHIYSSSSRSRVWTQGPAQARQVFCLGFPFWDTASPSHAFCSWPQSAASRAPDYDNPPSVSLTTGATALWHQTLLHSCFFLYTWGFIHVNVEFCQLHLFALSASVFAYNHNFLSLFFNKWDGWYFSRKSLLCGSIW